MSYTLKNELRTSLLVTAMAVVAPFTFAGGGGVDNDSPFGAPKSSSGGDEEPPSFADSGDCDGVTGLSVSAAEGASLQFDAVTTMAPQILLTTVGMLEGDPDHGFVAHDNGDFSELPISASVVIPAFEEIHAVSSTSGYSLQGRFSVSGDVGVSLKASAKSAHSTAFLVIGSDTGEAFVPEHIIRVPMTQGVVNVTELRDELAPHASLLSGKAAKVHVVGYTFALGGGWSVSHEAEASFPIAPNATIDVVTKP